MNKPFKPGQLVERKADRELMTVLEDDQGDVHCAGEHRLYAREELQAMSLVPDEILADLIRSALGGTCTAPTLSFIQEWQSAQD